MTTYTWQSLRDTYTTEWIDSPNAQLEQRILDVFERHPQLVVEAAEQVDQRFKRGVVRAPWVILAKHAEEGAVVAERATVPIKGERDKAKAVERAEQWIRAAGVLFDREAEIEAELFERMLRPYANDSELRERLLQLWHDERPRGELAEQEASEHATRVREARHAEARNEREHEMANPFL
jgi:hypothetical protein